MNSLPLVSVAIATYNGALFLRDQLDSIYNQTYKNIEVIATDDCSIDGTAQILQEYQQKQGLQYFINERNLGFVRNFERALSLCRGKYIALADQDDIWLPEKIEQLMNEIGSYSLIFSDAILIDRNGNEISASFKRAFRRLADTDAPFMHLCFKKFIYGCTMFFRSDLLEKALPVPDGICNHDWWLTIVAAKSNGIRFLDRKLMLYRQHDGNLIGHVKPHIILHKFLKFCLSSDREERKQFRKTVKKNIEATLNSRLQLNESERAMLTDALYFFDCFLRNELNMRVLFITYKYKNILFSKERYFIFEILHRILARLLNIYSAV